MKKILFLLLLSIAGYGQTSTGQEQEFDYGIKNNLLQTITTPTYIGTFGTDGTQGKIPSALIAKTSDIADSLATKENIANKSDSYTTSSSTTYASTKAIVDGLATKQNTLTNPITGTGTTNTIPKFTASGTVGNSLIKDNGTSVSISNYTTTNKFNVDSASQNSSSTLSSGAISVSNNAAFSEIIEMGMHQFGYGYLQARRSASASFSKLVLNPSGGNILLGTTTDNGIDKLQVNGSTKTTALTLATAPTTSAGTYDILTRNTSTGVVEKVLSNTIATVASPTFIGTPTSPTAPVGTNTTQIATTAFVTNGLGSIQNNTAYVDVNGNDTTAILGNIRKPYLTIDAALIALPSTGGIIKIGVGTFSSPSLSNIRDNVSFIGSGKPMANLTVTYIDELTKPIITSPTALIGGTILNGKFDVSLKNNIKAKDLGVDVGKTWCDAFNSGNATDGFVSAQNISFPTQPSSPQTRGLVIENISVLGYSATSLFHNTLVENAFAPQISNLSTYYNTYGLVLKTTGANVVNYDGHGHGGDAIIVKADTYAYSQNINLSNLYISSIGNYDCAGITLSGGTGNLQRVNISNANIEFTKTAIKSDGVVDEVNISNVNIKSTSERAIYLPSSVKNANLVNINQNGTGSGYNGIQLESDNNGVKIISNSKSSNTLGVGFSLTATGTGKVIVNGLDSYNNTTSYGISGNVYGSNITKNTAQTGELIFDSYGKIQSLRSFSAPTGGIDSNIGILSSNTSGFSGIGILAGNTSSSFIHFGDTDNSGEGQIEFYHGANSMRFKVSGIVPMSITSSGVNLTGTPTAPTAAAGTNTTQIATTAFVQANSSSGTYTPTLTNTTNVSSSTLNAAYYVRNGNIVTVTIAVQLTLTATTETVFTFSLPISGATVVNGIGQCNMTSGGGAVNGYGIVDITNSTTAQLRMGSTAVLGLGSGIANIMFTYSL